jgi:hypothetical protein
MADLKPDMAILSTIGRGWAARSKHLAARVPDLDIFSAGAGRAPERWMADFGEGRTVLEFMELDQQHQAARGTIE